MGFIRLFNDNYFIGFLYSSGIYHKILKNQTPKNTYCSNKHYPKILTIRFYHRVLCQKMQKECRKQSSGAINLLNLEASHSQEAGNYGKHFI